MKVSEYGIDFITEHEGVVLVPYRDQAGLLTVGVGHLLPRGTTDIWHRPITMAEAKQLLREDIADAERAIEKFVAVTISQNQVDALASLIFNISSRAFQNSTLLRNLNEGRFQEAANQFLVWDKITKNGRKVVSNGLAKRRAAERALFLTPA